MNWRDGLFKRLATAYEKGPKVVGEMHRLSYVGDKPFEKALRDIFADMGFAAKHDGGSGRTDVLVVATVGPESYRFIVEAKGSKDSIGNEAADVSAAANHRNDVNADHAIIVARQFAGFSTKGQEAAVYKECKATGGVSIMETDAIERLHSAIVKFSYPLPLLRDVLTTLDTPDEKMKRIEGLTTPVEGFNYRELLEQIWHRQGSTAEGDVVAYLSVFQEGGWKEHLDFPDFQRRIVALDTLAAGRIRLTINTKEVYLRQSPDLILDQIEKTLYGEGSVVEEVEDESTAPRDATTAESQH